MKLFFGIFCILLSFSPYAQGNLQFNRVVFIEADTTFTCIQGNTCIDSFLIKDIIVPVDKVLKIESITFMDFNYYGFYFNKRPLVNNANQGTTFPIWLPSGTYKFKYKSFGSMTPSPGSFTAQMTYHISGIEFNIVQ